jgi:hypothetical protein
VHRLRNKGMNLQSDKIQDDNLTYSEEERRAKAIEEVAKKTTLGTSKEENQPRFFSASIIKFFRVMTSIPFIGEYITSIIALIPIVILGIILLFPFNILAENIAVEYVIYILIFFFFFILIPIAYWWLLWIEREVRLVVCVPIPIIEIPVKYVLYPFMLPFFGIRFLYRKLRSNRNRVNN